MFQNQWMATAVPMVIGTQMATEVPMVIGTQMDTQVPREIAGQTTKLATLAEKSATSGNSAGRVSRRLDFSLSRCQR